MPFLGSTSKPIFLFMPLLLISFLLILSQVSVVEGDCTEQKNDQLIIAVPGEASFNNFVKITPSSNDQDPKDYSGFCIEVFDEVRKMLGFERPYKFVELNGTYDELVESVSNKMWLCDKLNLMTPPANDWWYHASGWNRPFAVTRGSEDEWVAFLASMGEDDISWRCHWLSLPAMTTGNMGSVHVLIAGLTGFSFYSPFRILRQLGLSQDVLPPGSEVLRLPPFTISGLRNYAQSWEARGTEPSDPLFSIAPSGRYRKWLRRDVKARMG